MSASLSHSASAEPNLTPMLDMVFQLITFFMLILNFKAQQMDLKLKLPVFGSARPMEKDIGDVITLNLDKDGNLSVRGQEQDLVTFVKTEAHNIREVAPRLRPGYKEGDPLPATIAIRADAQIRFAILYKAIQTCQQNGFLQFALKASAKPEG